jgi:2-furoyl-CoA dehydrogenase large subunit
VNVTGSRVIEAPAADVFAAICDPGTLMAVIPGCRGIERVGDEYRGEIALRLPGFAGTYRTTVRLAESVPPSHGRITGEANGALGSIRGDATFDLAEDRGRTTVTYAGQAAIDGPLARLDNRFAEGLAGSLIGQGLDALGTRLREQHRDRDGAPA